MYITFANDDGQERQKILKVHDESTFTDMTRKILSQFSLPGDEGKYAFKGKVEKNGPFVELDEKDEEILDDIIEI